MNAQWPQPGEDLNAWARALVVELTNFSRRVGIRGGNGGGGGGGGSDSVTTFDTLFLSTPDSRQPDDPIGWLAFSFGTEAKAGYLACNGQAVSRVAYAPLFAVIGETFGAGNGSSTFNLPTQADCYLIGAGGGVALGASAGANTVADHTHPLTATVDSSGDTGTWTTPLTVGDAGAHAHTEGTLAVTAETVEAGAHDHLGTTGTPSATEDVEAGTVPVASATHTHDIAEAGAHTHDVTADIEGSTGEAGTHSHTLSGGAHTHGVNGSVGAGGGHDNRPLSRGVNWFIKY